MSLDPFRQGEAITAQAFLEKLEAVRRLAEACQPLDNADVLFDRTPSGWTPRVRFPGDQAPPLLPFQGISADVRDTGGNVINSRVRVVYGQIGFAAGDFAKMRPDENGTDAHPFFYITNLADGDIITVHQTIAYDGNFWRVTASECLRYATGAVPSDTTTEIYHQLFAVNVDHYTRATTPQSPQMMIGNYEQFIAGNAAASQVKLVPL